MRRIYYAYAIHTVTNPTLLLGFAMLAVLIALTYFVSLGNVLQNMMLSAQVSNVDQFLVNAFSNTEAWTLVLLGAFIFAAFSFRFTLGGGRHAQGQFAHGLMKV